MPCNGITVVNVQINAEWSHLFNNASEQNSMRDIMRKMGYERVTFSNANTMMVNGFTVQFNDKGYTLSMRGYTSHQAKIKEAIESYVGYMNQRVAVQNLESTSTVLQKYNENNTVVLWIRLMSNMTVKCIVKVGGEIEFITQSGSFEDGIGELTPYIETLKNVVGSTVESVSPFETHRHDHFNTHDHTNSFHSHDGGSTFHTHNEGGF